MARLTGTWINPPGATDSARGAIWVRKRHGALFGAVIGVAMGMPLFGLGLLVSLLFGGGSSVVTGFLTDSTRVVTLLVFLHVATTVAGAAVGKLVRPTMPEGRRKGHLVLVKGTGKRSQRVS